MEMQIVGKPYAKALLDVPSVRMFLRKGAGVKDILDNCMVFVYNNESKTLSNEGLKTIIWGTLDWGAFIDAIKITAQETVHFDFYFVDYKDWVKFYPGTITKDGKIKFTEINRTGQITIVKQDLIQLIDFDLRNFIGGSQYSSFDDNTKPLKWQIEDNDTKT